jgi:hypothetical protein
MKTILGVKGLALSEFAIAANAILGIRDSGKTYTATEASEELFEAGVPFIWLDPIGVAHNLRIPGKGRGYPVVVAGGKHGDLPLTVKGVGELVRSAMRANVSLVLDLFSVELSKADWKRIVKDTCEILLHENSEHGLRHVFIEEAAEFVPQILRGADGQVFAAVEKLVRMGGNSKVGITLINQRSADLNKSVLELCANVFVHRQTGKNTLQDLKKWLGLIDPAMEKQITASLPELKSGQCWVMSNELKTPLLIKVPEKNSLHPDRRAATLTKAEAAKRQPVPADAFVAQMKAAMAEKAKPVIAARAVAAVGKGQPVVLVAPADAKAIQRRIEAARAEGVAFGREEGFLVGHHVGAGLASVVAKYAADHIRGLEAQLTGQIGEGFKLAQAQEFSEEQAGFVGCGGERILKKLRSQNRAPAAPSVDSPIPSAFQQSAAQPKGITPSVIPAGGAVGLDSPLQRIVDAIRYWNVFGIDAPTHQQVAFIANYVPGSGTWNRYLSSLRSSGIIEPRGDLKLTAEGVRLARDPAGEPSGEHLRGNILAKIDAPLARILTPVLEAYPSGMDHEAVAGEANYVAGSGTWNRYLSSLRSLDLIEPRGELKAQAWLFPEGA